MTVHIFVSLSQLLKKIVFRVHSNEYVFFSPFYLKKIQNWHYYTSAEILYKLQLTIHRIYYFIIYCLYSYHNRWQLASENPIGTLCVVSGHFVFFFYIFLCLVNMFSIILCTMSNKILPYHTIPHLQSTNLPQLKLDV